MAELLNDKTVNGETDFCEQMLSGCQDWFTDIEVCGSFAELPLEFVVMNITHIDVLISFRDVVAISDSRKEASLGTRNCCDLNLLETRICVDTAHAHSGFAQLKRTDCVYLLKRKPKMPEYSTVHGPAILVDFFKKNFKRYSQNSGMYRWLAQNEAGDVIFAKICEIFQNPHLDLVFSIKHPKWPDVASAWIHRKPRFISDDIIQKAISEGCHLVQKPHPTSKNPHSEWRFSFSVAERILINNWTNKQMYVYHILRMVKNSITEIACGEDKEKTSLRTYHFKTMMLWISEEMSHTFWDQTSVKGLVDHILLRMIWQIRSKCFPHYFIEGNNLMDHVNVTQMEMEIFENCRISAVHRIVIENHIPSNSLRLLPMKTINFVVSKLIEIRFDTFSIDLQPLISLSLHLPAGIGPLELIFIKPLHAAVLNQLHSLASSVDVNTRCELNFGSSLDEIQLRRSGTCEIPQPFHTSCNFWELIHPFGMMMIEFFKPTLRNFLYMVLETIKSTDFNPLAKKECLRSLILSPFEMHLNSITKKLLSSFEKPAREDPHGKPTSKQVFEDSLTTIDKKILVEILEMNFEIVHRCWVLVIPRYSCHCLPTSIDHSVFDVIFKIMMNVLQEPHSASVRQERGDHFKDKPGNKISQSTADESDTCWLYFVQCAYQINFEFTSLRAYEQVERETREVLEIDTNKYIWSNMQGFGVFYALLKTTWSQICDRNIQCILGFVTLINNVTKRDAVNGWIRVCPVLFLHYLRIQSLKMLNKPIFSAVEQMAEHIETCLVDRGTHETCVGTLVINTALVVSKISLRQYRRVYLRRFAVWNIPPDVTRNIDADTLVGFIKLCLQ